MTVAAGVGSPGEMATIVFQSLAPEEQHGAFTAKHRKAGKVWGGIYWAGCGKGGGRMAQQGDRELEVSGRGQERPGLKSGLGWKRGVDARGGCREVEGSRRRGGRKPRPEFSEIRGMPR